SATQFWSKSTRSARSQRRLTPSNSPRKTSTLRLSAIAPAKPRIPRSRISLSQRMPARSRRALCVEPIASPNTTSSSALRKRLAPTLFTGAKCAEVSRKAGEFSKDPALIWLAQQDRKNKSVPLAVSVLVLSNEVIRRSATDKRCLFLECAQSRVVGLGHRGRDCGHRAVVLSRSRPQRSNGPQSPGGSGRGDRPTVA